MADWKDRLNQKFTKLEEKQRADETGLAKSKDDERRFYTTIAGPALGELKAELERHGRTVDLHASERGASITVSYQGNQESRYAIETSVTPEGVYAYPVRWIREGGSTSKAFGYFSGGNRQPALSVTKDEIIDEFLRSYKPKG